MNNNTQLQQVLDHLKQFKTITQLDAINHFNCLRISAIRNAGYDIVTHHEPNMSNKGTHARYELKEVQQ